MKHLIIILLAITIIISCKKEPIEKAFLRGRLLDNCNNTPIANQTIEFHQNFKEGVNWLQADTEHKLLETTTTDENGYFFFNGDDYTSESMTSYSNSSIRLADSNLKLANGNLGQHYKSEGNDFSNPDLGNLFLNGMDLDVNLLIANNNDGVTYDSVVVTSSYYNVDTVFTTSSNGNFSGQLLSQNISIKNFWGDENNEKFNLYLKLEFYFASGSPTVIWKDFFFNECPTSADAVFEF